MPTITTTIQGIEYRAFLTISPHGIQASGIAFNDDADIVANVDPHAYIGYCHACITALTIARMAPTMDSSTIWGAMEDGGHLCACDDEGLSPRFTPHYATGDEWDTNGHTL